MNDPERGRPEDMDAHGHDGLTGDDLDALIAGSATDELETPAPAQPPSASRGQDEPGGPSAAPSSRPPAEPRDSAVRDSESPPDDVFHLPDFTAGAAPVDTRRITMLNDVKLNVKIELGRTRMLVEDVLKLNQGSVVELDKPAGDPVEVYVNDRLVARGEVLVLNDNFCVRISEVFAADPHRVSV